MEIQVIEKENFPETLRHSKYCPRYLYSKGKLKDVLPMIAVVGTREPTEYAQKWAFRMGQVLAENGYGVVSGLAKGIDAQAHAGCLDKGGYTVAVLGHGLDTIYPKENIPLAERILKQGGCLITEYEREASPQPRRFLQRNKIVVGLSKAVIIVETAEKSGTMNSYENAKAIGKPIGVMVYPENIRKQIESNFEYEKYLLGNQMILNNGGMPIDSRESLERFLTIAKKQTIQMEIF